MLPITAILPDLCRSVQDNRPVVLQAQPGAGKTTGIPPALLEIHDQQTGQPIWLGQQIWVVQPRRLAARSVAEFLARCRGERIGQAVGYHVRFDHQESAQTRIVMMTTGMFLRRMQSDPLLDRVGCVVLDEFHERSLELDLALGLANRLRCQLREDLRLIVMSATLDPQPIASYLGDDTHCIECPGRTYPVAITYRPPDHRARWEVGVVDAIRDALEQNDGHVLVFLPGVGEIRNARKALMVSPLPSDVCVYDLHGSLTPHEQDQAVQPPDSPVRKVILSTNLAETSITIDGVAVVIDTGLAKIPRLDTRSGLTRLETSPISIASADQRAGRAGRTGPGNCYRLWDEGIHRTRQPFDVPEILRAELSSAMLGLAALGENDFEQFAWLDPPPAHALDSAVELLRSLSAIDPKGRITTLGRSLAGIPVHPRAARFAIELKQFLPTRDVAKYTARLSETGRLFAEDVPKPPSHLNRVEKQLQATLGKLDKTLGNVAKATGRSIAEGDLSTTAIAKAVLSAYPDRVIRSRDGDRDRGVMVGGRGVIGLSKIGAGHHEGLWVGVDVDGKGTDARVRFALPIESSWLSAGLIQDEEEIEFDAQRESLVCRRVTRFMDLVLNQTPIACQSSEHAQQVLFAEAVQQRSRVVPTAKSNLPSEIESILVRLEMISRYLPDETPVKDPGDVWRSVCFELCVTRVSFAQLRSAPWKDYLVGEIGYDAWQEVEKLTPTHLKLPGGRQAPIHYDVNKPPRIEARIGECFGLSQTPRILGGRLAVQMHLLGPNDRPQQITEDLASFWANTYIEIRKELRRRYPKHHWPEDPLNAVATRNGLKPRS